MQESTAQNRSTHRNLAAIDSLSLVSYLAPNLFWFYEAIAAAWERAASLKTQLVQSQFDPLSDPLLQQNQWDVAFICGLPFARHHRLARHDRTASQPLKLLAAPVMQTARYEDRPVYFADVIVQAASQIDTFDDLAGKTLCYNDRGSNSGYNLLRQHLMQGNYPQDFFARALPSGAHQQSIRWVAAGLADCAAIDSTVLEQECRDFPELAAALRVVASIGPCPMPPLAVAQHLSSEAIALLQSTLLQPDAELQATMQQARIRRFAIVQIDDYQAIAAAYDAAIQAGYEQL